MKKPRISEQSALLSWYAATARDLPWRRTRDPYRVLVSEVMLQQTQVARVVPFYERFLERFPDERELAVADDETIHRLWKGLGYPSRVERLRAACQAVVARGGAWPRDPAALQELPGLGPYTSHALACFAFGAVVPVVDTNVARVYARRDGLALPVDKVALWTHAAREVDRDDPRAYTNALMDLGATVCTARTPQCGHCPWRPYCRSAGDEAAKAAAATPLKVATPKHDYRADLDPKLPRLTVVLALIHDDDGRYLVARRHADAHCGGLWELPGGKREKGEDLRRALAREVREELGAEVLSARAWMRLDVAYPDRAVVLHVFRCRLFDPSTVRPLASQELRWVTPAEFCALAMPDGNRPIQARLSTYRKQGRTAPHPDVP